MTRFDVAVIGAGAAGMSAATAAAGAGLSCVIIDPMAAGGELMNLGVLSDCPGLASGTTGPDLAADLLQKTIEAGVELALGTVTELRLGATWAVSSDAGVHSARAVIIASGLKQGRLGLPDEERFAGRGISHCAACDGPLYAGQPVIVTGDDRWVAQEAIELVAFASSVTLISQDERPARPPGVTVSMGRITGLRGGNSLDGVSVVSGNVTRDIAARGLFVQCGRDPSLDFAAKEFARDHSGRLLVDPSLQCSVPGLFAAGGSRQGFEATITAAMSDGRMAASSVVQALRSFRAGQS